MNPIDDLKMEHQAVMESLRVLRHIAHHVSRSKRIIHKDDIKALLDFFRVFVDRCHHGKEEKLLFPALEDLGVGHDGGPIAVMLSEHEQGRSFTRGLKEAMEMDFDNPAGAATLFVHNAHGLIDLLTRHIEKENHVLFPIGEHRLSPEQMGQLQKGFDRIEAEEVGAGRHAAFHALLERLAREYPEEN